MSEPTKSLSPVVMATEDQALEKYTYRPLDKVGSVGTLKALLQAQERSLAAVLPRHLTPDRLFRTLLTAVNRSPDLLECTQASVVESVSRAAELGLDVSGTLQEAWILPFNNNIGTKENPRWVKQATLLPGFRGLAKLARNSGEVTKLEARAVKEKDHFEVEFGSNARLVFKPYLQGDRGRTVSCYAYAKLASGEEVVDWMTVDDVERIRKMSKQPNSLMWRDHWDEGARKTVFRRLSKWLPLSAEKSQKFLDALAEADQEFNLDGFAEAVTVLPAGRESGGVAALEERVAAQAERLKGASPEVVVEVVEEGLARAREEDSAAKEAAFRKVAPQSGAAQPTEAEAGAAPGKPVDGVRLSAQAITQLRGKASAHKVAWGDVEEYFGGPIEQYFREGADDMALWEEAEDAIRLIAKRAREAAAKAGEADPESGGSLFDDGGGRGGKKAAKG